MCSLEQMDSQSKVLPRREYVPGDILPAVGSSTSGSGSQNLCFGENLSICRRCGSCMAWNSGAYDITRQQAIA